MHSMTVAHCHLLWVIITHTHTHTHTDRTANKRDHDEGADKRESGGLVDV